MVRIAQIGAGRMGGLHAANAASNPRIELTLIADNELARADALAREVGATAATIDQILDDDKVEGVIVATSTSALLETALNCLRRGKAVFCEKPLSLSLAELEEATAEIVSAPAPLFVAFNRRFDPSFAALKRRLDDGEIGELETLHLINHDPALPSLEFVPRSGGLFRDFTVHDFDTAAWLLQEPFTEVFAWGAPLIDAQIGALGDIDTAKLVLRTVSGKLCLISNSRRTGYGYDQRIEAFGSRGSLIVENINRDAVAVRAESGSRRSPIHYAFPDRYAEAYQREIDHFVDVVEGSAAPQTGIHQATAALRLAAAAAKSASSNQPSKIQIQEPYNA